VAAAAVVGPGTAISTAEQQTRSKQASSDVDASQGAAKTSAVSDGTKQACDGHGASQAAGGATHVGIFSGGSAGSLDLQALEKPLEQQELTVSAWVFVEPPTSTEVMSIHTIISNKESGCEADSGHYGFAIFVNEWNTNSEQLYLSWGNEISGCEELATEPHTLKPGKWTHIAAVFDTDGAVVLYIGGQLMAHSRRDIGRKRIIGNTTPLQRKLNTAAPLRIGAHADKTHPFRGSIAKVTLWHKALTEEQVNLQMRCSETPSLPPPYLAVAFKAEGPVLAPTGSASLSFASLPRKGQFVTVPANQIDNAGSLKRQRSISLPSRVDERPFATLDTAARTGSEGWPLPWLSKKSRPTISAEARNASDAEARVRVEHVRGVFKRAWNAYRKYAWGADELKPVSNRSHDWLHLGATMIDCLDNLWLFGMHEEFKEAQIWVATRWNVRRANGISMFETVIRILGGLLSAYELSGEAIFLAKAQEVADHMMYAFDMNAKTGLPCTTISFTGSKVCNFPSWTGHSAILAEYGTIQLEFKYLAHHTGHKKYWEVAERPMRLVHRLTKPHGLFPTFINPVSGTWSTQKITFGALADSFYEYLIKQWLITNKKETYLRQMFDDAMFGMAKLLVQKSTPSGLVYIADWTGSSLTHKMDHLACFAAAMLVVGAQDGHKYDGEYMALAEALGDTCYEMYAHTATGLSPEFVQFAAGSDMMTPRSASYNIGRPEAVESFWVLWYYTRDPKWRNMGWEVFKAFERHAATGSGWTALPDVENPKRKRDDKMESFVLAETMKYLFLLFDVEDSVPLEKYVMNTEAHPLGRFESMSTEPAVT